MDALGQREIFLSEGFHLDRRGLFRRDVRGILTPVAIGGRALDLLRVLVEHREEVLSKTEIMAAVWPQMVVEDSNLAFQMAALRRVLDPGRTEASCIQTVARRGYRFAAPVIRFEAEALDRAAAIPHAGARPLPRLSIIVLPFVNLSNDPEQGYFAEGITEDLTTDLSQMFGHFVIGGGTALIHDSKSADAKQLGRELGVHYVLQGSVRRSGSRVRMNVRLTDTETAGLLWAERFEMDRRTISAAEDEILGRLVRTLHLELLEDADRRSRTKRPADPDMHDLLIRGWAWFCRPRSASTLRDAQREFERALALEPSSVEARIGLATVLAAFLLEGWSNARPQDQAQVERLLAEVFARVTNHSMAHQAMAMLRRSQNRLTEARIEAERAIALDRNNSGALYELGLAYMYLGQPSAGIPHMMKAIGLSSRDPLVSDVCYGLGRCHLLLGHFDQAIELFYRVRAVRPQYRNIHMWLAAALGCNADLDGARAELDEAIRLKPGVNSLARWRACQPSIGVQQYWALCEKTLNAGLRRAGFPEE
jgi:TolB-like protein/Tfp pilus assembly protein PilF